MMLKKKPISLLITFTLLLQSTVARECLTFETFPGGTDLVEKLMTQPIVAGDGKSSYDDGHCVRLKEGQFLIGEDSAKV